LIVENRRSRVHVPDPYPSVLPLKKKRITEHRYKPMLVSWVFSERTSGARFDISKVVVGSPGVSLSLILKKIKLAISDLTIFEKFKSL